MVTMPRAVIPVPAIRTAAPQSWFSGLARAPQPLLVFDDDVPPVGGPTNCNLRPTIRQLGNAKFLIAGVTRDASGAILPGCTVKLFTSTDDVLRYTAVSGADGSFSFSVPSNGWTFYALAYLPGAPDVAGATVNTLRGA